MKKSPLPNTYQDQEIKLLKRFDRYLPHIHTALTQFYTLDERDHILGLTLVEFRNLLPEVPFIGQKNLFRFNLIDTAMLLALYRVLRREKNIPLEQFGKVVHDTSLCITNSQSKGFGKWLTEKLMFAGLGEKIFSKAAQRTQKREYQGDWVFECIPGDGEFDLGLDIYECGIHKFLKAQGAEEIGPYLCLMDFIFSQAKASGLRRTSTLTEGGDLCDFRWKKGRDVQIPSVEDISIKQDPNLSPTG